MELFRSYAGTGLIVGFFLVAEVYLFFTEKDKVKRILLLYVPAVLLILFFNPLFCEILYGFIGDEIYYRILWLIPITAVLAYTISVLYQSLRGKMKRIFLLFAAVMVMISGSLIYQNVNFRKADNLYHIPREVVEICDSIEIEGREVMAAFPEEFLQYVRQYSALVCMPYGREVFMGEYNEFYQLMRAEEISVERLAALAKQYQCHYVIVSENKSLIGDMTEYDYDIYKQIGEYVIYKDTTMNFSLN